MKFPVTTHTHTPPNTYIMAYFNMLLESVPTPSSVENYDTQHAYISVQQQRHKLIQMVEKKEREDRSFAQAEEMTNEFLADIVENREKNAATLEKIQELRNELEKLESLITSADQELGKKAEIWDKNIRNVGAKPALPKPILKMLFEGRLIPSEYLTPSRLIKKLPGSVTEKQIENQKKLYDRRLTKYKFCRERDILTN